jgi:hypothetical protein
MGARALGGLDGEGPNATGFTLGWIRQLAPKGLSTWRKEDLHGALERKTPQKRFSR